MVNQVDHTAVLETEFYRILTFIYCHFCQMYEVTMSFLYLLYTDDILQKLQYVLNILLVIVIDHLIGVRFKKLARLDKDNTKERDDVELKRCSVFCSEAVQREEKLVKILIVAIKGYWLSFPTCLGDKVSINTGPCERSVLPHGPADFGVKPASSG